jgi:hypothetical protein
MLAAKARDGTASPGRTVPGRAGAGRTTASSFLFLNLNEENPLLNFRLTFLVIVANFEIVAASVASWTPSSVALGSTSVEGSGPVKVSNDKAMGMVGCPCLLDLRLRLDSRPHILIQSSPPACLL